jgi:hypothetical protein
VEPNSEDGAGDELAPLTIGDARAMVLGIVLFSIEIGLLMVLGAMWLWTGAR